MKFTKMHGIGNDFVLIDTIRDGEPEGDLMTLAQKLCDRRFGIGSDGLILVENPDSSLTMRMFNPDGSESEMCGNGLRTFARLCHDRGYGGDTFPVATGAGTLQVTFHDDQTVSVNMGPAILSPEGIGMTGVTGSTFVGQDIGKGQFGTAVSMGNPHLVILVEDISKIELEVEGPRLERHAFFPRRTNVHFVQIDSSEEISMRTWERGAGATLACGTGACASAVAAYLNGKTGRKVKVNLPGGSLNVDYQDDGTVLMRGPAEYSFEGSLSDPL
ncbi:MAG: diaminopimelate epimerase [Armatimonadetes bacterium]|nr:diaminopimelate epimerase [Armatimonadota bacterium]